jgi:hypothetical protein
MSNRVWVAVLSLTVALGVWIGYRLSVIPALQPYKLLNLVGLLYSLLAVVVLSEVFIANENWKRICVERIAPVLLWSHSTVPIGAAIGAGSSWLLGRGPSASVVGLFALGGFSYMMTVGFVLEQTVVLPRFFKRDIESRWSWFGLILLVTGMLLQLASAIKGL